VQVFCAGAADFTRPDESTGYFPRYYPLPEKL
jgi:hypothetical protein